MEWKQNQKGNFKLSGKQCKRKQPIQTPLRENKSTTQKKTLIQKPPLPQNKNKKELGTHLETLKTKKKQKNKEVIQV